MESRRPIDSESDALCAARKQRPGPANRQRKFRGRASALPGIEDTVGAREGDTQRGIPHSTWQESRNFYFFFTGLMLQFQNRYD